MEVKFEEEPKSKKQQEIVDHFKNMTELLNNYLNEKKAKGFSIEVDYCWTGVDQEAEAIVMIAGKAKIGSKSKNDQ